MTKKDVIAKVAEKTGLSKKDSDLAIGALLEIIEEALVAGEKVSFVGFGAFEPRERAERTGTNPRTKEPITIPATVVPAFKAGSKLKEAVAASV